MCDYQIGLLGLMCVDVSDDGVMQVMCVSVMQMVGDGVSECW